MEETPDGRRQSTLLRRAGAWIVDYTIVMVPAAVLVVLALLSLVRALPAYVGGVGGEVGWSSLSALILHHSDAGSLRAAASGEWISFAMPLLLALLAFPLLQFCYLATMLLWRGRTVGKMLTDVRVATWGDRSGERVRRGRAVRRAFWGTLSEAGLVSVAFTTMAVGQFTIGLFLWLVAIGVFWLNVLSALGPRHRTIVDRLSGTIVVRQLFYAQVAEQTAAFAKRVAVAGRRTPGAVAELGKVTADAAAIAGQLTREGAEALRQSTAVQQALDSQAAKRAQEAVQQALDSQAAKRAQELGAAGAVHVRRAGGLAAGKAKIVGARAQALWQERQARRGGPDTPELPPAE